MSLTIFGNGVNVPGTAPGVVGKYDFAGSVSSSLPQPMKGDFVSVLGNAPHEGVPTSMGDVRITYKLVIAVDTANPRAQDFVQSEPIFVVAISNTAGISKAFSLAQLNHILLRQHEVILADLSLLEKDSKRTITFRPDLIITEDNFSRKINYAGFISDVANVQNSSYHRDSEVANTKVTAPHIYGKLDAAPLWATEEIPLVIGSGLGFVVKRMNATNNMHKEKYGSLLDAVKAIGPLQVLPIASHQKQMFMDHTLETPEEAVGLMNNYKRLNMRSYGKDTITNYDPRPAKDGPTHKASLDVMFDHMKEDYATSAYLRGTSYVTISDLMGKITKQPSDQFPYLTIRTGQVINVGFVLDVFAPGPPAEYISLAINERNRNTSGYKHGEAGPTNTPHATLLDTYGFHLYCTVKPGPFHMDVDRDDEFRGGGT